MTIISPSAISSKLDLALNGVIHIGGHDGQEIDEYIKLGLKKIHIFEANDEHAASLNSYAAKFPQVSVHYVAVSDRKGFATFNLMSESQSSSLLELKVHADIYPDIKKVAQKTVETTSLDEFLSDQDIADVNYLNIDIQGAELAALRGAERTLRHIDLIIVEVNFAEMYEGCPLVEEIDLFLFDRGFIRVQTATPFHSTWGDAAYVRSSLIRDISLIELDRRHTVTMSSFGSNGRFANQLFQYLFIVLYGLRSGCKAILPAVHSLDYLNFPMSGFGETSLPALPWLRSAEASLLQTNAPARDVDLWGYFQGLTDAYRVHRHFIRKLLEPNETIRGGGHHWLQKVRSRFKRIIGIHIRRGDYFEFDAKDVHTFARIPVETYLQWLRSNFEEGDGLFISTDDETEIARFGEFPILNNLFPRDVDIANHQGDFYLLSQCDVAAYCNSSWSFMSALLAAPGQQAHLIDFSTLQFAQFDPWNEILFWRRFRPLRGDTPLEWHDENIAFLLDVAETKGNREATIVRLQSEITGLQRDFADSQRDLHDANAALAEMRIWFNAPARNSADMIFSRILGSEKLVSLADALPLGQSNLVSQFCRRAQRNYQRYRELAKSSFNH